MIFVSDLPIDKADFAVVLSGIVSTISPIERNTRNEKEKWKMTTDKELNERGKMKSEIESICR